MDSIVVFLAFFIAFVLFIFINWRKLKEDYVGEQIFLLLILSLFVAGTLSFAFYLFNKDYWIWIFLIVYHLSLYLYTKKYKYNFFDFFDNSTTAFFSIGGLIFLIFGIYWKAPLFLVEAGIFYIFYFLFFILRNIYRDLSWYKSGRIGFSSSVSLGVYFLVKPALILLGISLPIINKPIEIIVSGIASLFCFLVLYNLSKD